MKRLLAGVVAVVMCAGCGGALAQDEETDLPDDFDSAAGALVTEESDEDADADDDDRECDRDHDDDNGKQHKKRGHKRHRHKKLFRKLDRLDGDKDGRIVIASLPPRLPELLIAKLHVIDVNQDGAVSRDEARAARKGQ